MKSDQAVDCRPLCQPCMHITSRRAGVLQVTLVHLYQAGMFADLDQINAAPHAKPLAGCDGVRDCAPAVGAKVSAAEAPLKEEVQHKLQHLPPALFSKCQQVCSHYLCLYLYLGC